jgi:hypothetical protein
MTLPREVYKSKIPQAAETRTQIWEYIGEFGYYGGEEIESSNEGLMGKLTTWEEFVKQADWSKVL